MPDWVESAGGASSFVPSRQGMSAGHTHARTPTTERRESDKAVGGTDRRSVASD